VTDDIRLVRCDADLEGARFTLGHQNLDAPFYAMCRRLAPGSTPTVLLRHEPPEWAKPNCCFDNCDTQVELAGGSVEYGWVFCWPPRNAVIVAMGHAVWRRPEDGERVDITPRRQSVLLPMKTRQWPPLTVQGRAVFLGKPGLPQ
jgi:hypothetical protein